MMVIFISQCSKKAIKRTQRILDAFANRIGDRTWQTVITEEGLLSVKKLLKKTVTKNSAIACHWIRSRRFSELLWIVGSRYQFNAQGLVPVNITQQELVMDIVTMKAKKEGYYANTHLQHLAEHQFAVGYLAQQLFYSAVNNDDYKQLAQVAFLAGCLHDLGKVDPLFQQWVKKGKRKNSDDDGQHIDTQSHFEKHPRHNEISLLLFYLFEDQITLTQRQKEQLKHVIYWHHAKPFRKKNNFIVLGHIVDFLCKNLGGKQRVDDLVAQSLILLNETADLAKTYLTDRTILNDVCDGLAGQKMTEIPTYFKQLNFPYFKHYSAIDTSNIAEQIQANAVNNLLRSCVISADRLISQLSASELTSYIKQQRLAEIIDKLQEESPLTSQLNDIVNKFADSSRTQQQNQVAETLAERRDIAVLAGPAGCGKTRIALEWARLKQAQKIIWVCPRVQICQSIFTELTENYLPDSHIEILTGEFKFTHRWDNPTKSEDYFAADIVVTTIDQIVSSITTHTKIDALLPFMSAHIIFDEYHEYINMDIFNLLFAELITAKNMRANWQKNSLLVSATPHYLYLQDILSIDLDDVVEMTSFNQSHYQINFIEYDETELGTNPFFRSYSDHTFVISNTALMAQQGFILHQQRENSLLFHAKFKRSDKKYWFTQVCETFGEHGTRQYQILRSGPIVQASFNITCDQMVTEISSAENILQRLGRLDRFGKNRSTNILKIAITESVKRGKPKGRAGFFLDRLHSLQSAKAWYDFLQANLKNKIFQLPELYQLYRAFYAEDNYRQLVQHDLCQALAASIRKLNEKILEPIKVYSKADNHIIRISKHALRADSRFVQLALLDVENYQQPIFINQYAYSMPLKDSDTFDNLTESLDYIKQQTNVINFMIQNQHHIDDNHPINKEKIPRPHRENVITNYARNPEYPLYLSYIEDDLNRIGGSSLRSDEAIYYAVCSKQPIGLISYQKILSLNPKN
ncbi:CRISPR-associated endonuclease Cas3'' [Utexia brackfieldae]|uniref:CRISPR-associated endonuclease Cas3'' n=1 Tax=Utexia brackfieldae TaxID=3074108 RepID=UPI00370D9C27